MEKLCVPVIINSQQKTTSLSILIFFFSHLTGSTENSIFTNGISVVLQNTSCNGSSITRIQMVFVQKAFKKSPGKKCMMRMYMSTGEVQAGVLAGEWEIERHERQKDLVKFVKMKRDFAQMFLIPLFQILMCISFYHISQRALMISEHILFFSSLNTLKFLHMFFQVLISVYKIISQVLERDTACIIIVLLLQQIATNLVAQKNENASYSFLHQKYY